MNDLSLGRLRIANPDDESGDYALESRSSSQSAPTIPPPQDTSSIQDDYVAYLSQSEPPRIDRGYSASSSEFLNTNLPSNYTQRRPERSPQPASMPQTFHDQQPSQFSQYPATMAHNLQERNSASSRPNSMYYAQLPVNNTGNGLTRQGSYRMRGEGSGTSTPQRSSSKRNEGSGQAGVPSRDDLHSDRSYRQPSYPLGNAAIPPRRTSRVTQPSRTGVVSSNSNLTGTSLPAGSAISSSPYNAESGLPQSSEEWQERGAAVTVQRDYDANGQPIIKSTRKGVKDFNFGATLGEGSYSTVLAAQDRITHKDYAIKVLDKRHIIKEQKVKYVNIEKETLNRLSDHHPGVVRLYYTFQDERSLYFVLDLCTGGELLGTLKRIGTFDEECTKFYAAQILDTIAYMHSRGIIHRDLKPENVLLDDNRHVKITDFGTAKMLKAYKNSSGVVSYDADSSAADDRANSFVGTAEYVSPELLNDKNACKASDLWAFGCIVYQLLAGRPPFKAANEYLTFQKIMALEYEFPPGFPDVARDLVERLLVLDPVQRLSLEHVKNHQFFEGVRWGRGLWQQKAPRLKPYIPPPNPPIRLNGSNAADEAARDMISAHATHSTIIPPSGNPPKLAKPRVITELPPPSQLDIDWSPVLTRNNERILKLGNLIVNIAQGPYNPTQESGNKLSRFFGGNTTKKRQRLVMVTSSARIVIAAAGGEEKKAKAEINLVSPGVDVTSATDSKGVTHWVVNTREKHYIFEDAKTPATELHASAISAEEWLDVIETAKEMSKSQASATNNNFSTDEISSSAFSSHSTLDQQPELNGNTSSHGHGNRAMLQRQGQTADNESAKGRKRFSKRQSKSGLTAVF